MWVLLLLLAIGTISESDIVNAGWHRARALTPQAAPSQHLRSDGKSFISEGVALDQAHVHWFTSEDKHRQLWGAGASTGSTERDKHTDEYKSVGGVSRQKLLLVLTICSAVFAVCAFVSLYWVLKRKFFVMPAKLAAAINRLEETCPVHVLRAPSADEVCAVCLVAFLCGAKVRTLPCAGNHTFHKDCIDSWFTSELVKLQDDEPVIAEVGEEVSCPICRKKITVADPSTPAAGVIGKPYAAEGEAEPPLPRV
eukprot:gnl/TRDRNA2_/TRDRNA2_34882_c0_seq2.p1 gnl/TRDRNA2_/TRDRNA2_34882_c0~~gnl/TRDRNA2_/TRDRNA2_34882_c0_seq2.p1  ORF type:complete len:253 (-),score=28.01 gnl/TRDRNA2_/TRDRNA2_34882_c0_seq2:188-946(-)